MTREEKLMQVSRGLAAQAWCAETTETKTMDPELAEEFAKILFENGDEAMLLDAWLDMYGKYSRE
jgi:hypothetical protein